MTGIKISFLVTKVFQKWNNGLGVIYILILTSLFCEMALALSDWTDIGPPRAVTLGVYCHPTEANIIYYIADTGQHCIFCRNDKKICALFKYVIFCNSLCYEKKLVIL